MTTRAFELKDSKSDKFWTITLDGRAHTVHFGRRGTSGQEQTKEFGSEEEARKSHEKLIAEKLKKGYVEVTPAGGAAAPAAPSRPPPAPRAPPARPPAETAAPPAAPPASPPPAALAERSIDLDPLDWAVATWRKLKIEVPPPRPFDLDACFERLRKLRVTDYGWSLDWSAVDIPPAISREEAHFWFDAVSIREQKMKPKDWEAALRGRRFDGSVTIGDVRQALKGPMARSFGDKVLIALRSLLSSEELAGLILGGALKGRQTHEYNVSFLHGFCRHVVPYQSDQEADSLRASLRPKVTPRNWPADFYVTTELFQLAAALGMHGEVRAVVESWKDDLYGNEGWGDHYHQPQRVIYGLESAALVEQHMRRLGLQVTTADHLRGWLAHTEWNALDLVKQSLLASTNRENCEALIEILHSVHAPEAAGPMLELRLKSKAPKAAGEWFERNPAHAVAGLVPVAAGRSPLADAACEMLRGLKRKGLGALIEGSLGMLSAEAADMVRRDVIDHEEVELPVLSDPPDWLSKGVEEARASPKRFKPPAWAAPDGLPPLVLDGRRLSEEQCTGILAALRASSLDAPSPLLLAACRHLDRLASDAFAWKLFERWLAEGAPSKEKWAMAAIGHLGGDESVLKLAPMIRAWPGEAQHQRAVLGLEVLRAIGTDAALMQLNGIAQKLKFQALKAKARQFMEEIARAKGLSRAELEDRVVPDCGLDERGRRVFEAGGKTFELVLGPEMKPMVKDPAGKMRTDLPGSAGEAISAEWKRLKKQIREVAAIQAVRLEHAMVTGRRWKAPDFEALIARHPLMTHLARLLVWGIHDDEGRLVDTFRVTAEQDFADVKDDPFELPPGARVGLVHALHLDDDQKRAWGQLLADYEVTPPFPQIGRGAHRLQPGEEKLNKLGRHVGFRVPAPGLVYTLEKLGWVRGLALDGGCFDEHSRQFPGAGVTAVVSYEGTVGMGYIDPNEELTMKGCYFLAGLREPSGYESYEKKALRLGEVDPVVISETIHDLEVVASKGKKE
jgi:predicted DNA-binding WGR domain protein